MDQDKLDGAIVDALFDKYKIDPIDRELIIELVIDIHHRKFVKGLSKALLWESDETWIPGDSIDATH